MACRGDSNLSGQFKNGKDVKSEIALKAVSELRPIDDIFFEKLIEEDGVCEELLQVVLEDPDLEVKEIFPQGNVKNLRGRSVRLDAICKLSTGKYCDVEVQKANNDNHFKRVRYNASCITANITEPGIRFCDVPNVCIVYITTFDILKKGKTVYHAHQFDDETHTFIDDGLSYVYVNTKIDDKTKIARLMKCFMQTEVNESEFPKLTNGVCRLKNSKEGVNTMCQAWEKYNEEIEARGEARGEAKGEAKGIIRMGRRFHLSDDAIVQTITEETQYTADEAREFLLKV